MNSIYIFKQNFLLKITFLIKISIINYFQEDLIDDEAAPVGCVNHSCEWHCIKKWNFPLRISLVNVAKSAVSCGFGHIY